MEKLELPKNKTNREVLNEEYFAKAAPAVYEAISNAYREGYHTGWMRAAKFYTKKYNPDEVEKNAESAELSSRICKGEVGIASRTQHLVENTF